MTGPRLTPCSVCGGMHSHRCDQPPRESARSSTQRPVRPGDVFVSRSGRRWEACPSRYDRPGRVLMSPLGSDTYGFGGVKAVQTQVARLENETHGWRRA